MRAGPGPWSAVRMRRSTPGTARYFSGAKTGGWTHKPNGANQIRQRHLLKIVNAAPAPGKGSPELLPLLVPSITQIATLLTASRARKREQWLSPNELRRL